MKEGEFPPHSLLVFLVYNLFINMVSKFELL